MIGFLTRIFGFGAARLDPYKAGRIMATHTMLQASMAGEDWEWAQRIIDNDPYDCVWPGIKEIVRQRLAEAMPCLPPS